MFLRQAGWGCWAELLGMLACVQKCACRTCLVFPDLCRALCCVWLDSTVTLLVAVCFIICDLLEAA